MKLDTLPVQTSEPDNVISPKNVREFAKKFVQDIIQEAIKQSSQTAWLIHCSENCHKLTHNSSKQEKSFLYWTPESKPENESNDSAAEDMKNGRSSYMISCNSVNVRQLDFMNDSIYSLPVDSLHQVYGGTSNNRMKHYKTLSNCNKCLKPKAVHALNVFKSTHHKTFNDFKLFLINLYSSNDISVKKLGSEHSAFTKYRRQSTSNEESLNYEEEKISNLGKNENLKLMCIKNEKDPKKPIRKCNRIKRCNFFSIKHSFCSVFKSQKTEENNFFGHESMRSSFKDRSLPPPPVPGQLRSKQQKMRIGADCNQNDLHQIDRCSDLGKKLVVDFASNIEKVKDYGWYWGPMSSEAAEKLLANEPDGSFIVRDSSDDRYIFSLTFKLNACIRHVRIEHGQGNFSFGNDTNFKSDTIVDFIENAIQHSRSGRYLFFIHRRPVLGPIRVLLLYPVSRFKGHVQSLQHMCRFVILKTVRRDLIPSLPLPKPLIEYLGSKDYYTEQTF